MDPVQNEERLRLISEISVEWHGFRSSVHLLTASGWGLTYRTKMAVSNRGTPIWVDGYWVYLTHDQQIGRFTLPAAEKDWPTAIGVVNAPVKLDFLVHRKQFGKSPLRIRDPYVLSSTHPEVLSNEINRVLTTEDIPALYGIILDLQKDYPAPQPKKVVTPELKEAEVIRLDDILEEYKLAS